MEYRREIDGLRALAVLSVILFHAEIQPFGGGFVGVDVFFVISGYLMTCLITGELRDERFSLTDFYERRVRRIVPALYLMMFVCLPFAWKFLLPRDMLSFSKSLAAVPVFGSNIMFWGESGYFDIEAGLKPLLHTWSLAVEEQYYLLFPLLLICVWRYGRKAVLAVTGLLMVASFIFGQYVLEASPSTAFYLLPARAWELFLGGMVAFLRDPVMTPVSPEIRRQFMEKRDILAALGLCMVIGPVIMFGNTTPFPGVAALIPTLGAALIIGWAEPDTLAGRFLGNRVFVGIGLVSYSAYLWHQPLFAFAKYQRVVGGYTWVLVVVTFGLAYVSWRFIERPFRNKEAVSRQVILALAILGSVMFAVFGLSGWVTKGFPMRAEMKRFAVFDYKMEVAGYEECSDPLLKSAGLNLCLFPEDGTVDAVVIGDSHAGDKFFGIEKNVSSKKWALIANSSCPPVLNIDVEGDQKGCREKFEKVIAWVDSRKGIGTVVMSFYGYYTLMSSYSADHLRRGMGPETIRITGENGGNRRDIFYGGLSKTVSELVNHGKKVVVLVDVPELPYFPVECERWKIDCLNPEERVEERLAEHRAILAKLKADYPSIAIFDPTNAFCKNGDCGYRNGDTVLYRDSHHLTLPGSDWYGKLFSNWFANQTRAYR